MKSLISLSSNSTTVVLRTTTCHYRGAGMKLLFLPLPQFQSLDTDSPPLTRFFKTVERQPKAGASWVGGLPGLPILVGELAGLTYYGAPAL